MPKEYLDINVLEAAQARIKKVFDDFPKVYVSFSGGKDSSVMLHLVMEVLRLKQITGMAELFSDAEFSKAWE